VQKNRNHTTKFGKVTHVGSGVTKSQLRLYRKEAGSSAPPILGVPFYLGYIPFDTELPNLMR